MLITHTHIHTQQQHEKRELTILKRDEWERDEEEDLQFSNFYLQSHGYYSTRLNLFFLLFHGINEKEKKKKSTKQETIL